MREKRTFAERTKTRQSDEVKRKYFLVYEGASTEAIYFNSVENRRDEVGIDSLFEMIPIIRSYSEDGWSNPEKILNRILADLEEEKSGQITYESLLNRIMGYLYDEKILTTSRVQAHAIWRILVNGCEMVLDKALTEDVLDIEDDCHKLIRYLNQESDIVNIVEDISDYIKSSKITYADGFDKICLIVDRDKDSFLALPENDQYGYVLQTCRKRGFGFYVSNPCFEFWLLLHFDEVFGLDKEMLLENPQVTTKRRYAEQELRRLLPGYTKSRYNSQSLMANMEKAIRNAEQFCVDEERLVSEVGTNIGKMIRELQNKDNTPFNCCE